MKKAITFAVIFGLLAILGFPKQTFASASDTLVVYASGPTLDQVINDDSTSTGQQAHSAYKLVSLDTTYIFMSQITPRSNISVIGALGADGRPPCIQPGVLNDGSIPTPMFNFARSGKTVVFKNLYLEGLSTNGSYAKGYRDVVISADSVRVYADNVIFDNTDGDAFVYIGNWDDFFITNCKFRNGVDPTVWTDASFLASAWPARPYLDTVVIKYSTFLCNDGYDVVGYTIARHIEFTHNNVVYSFMQPLFIFAAFQAKVDDNIFYAPFVAGEMKSEYPWWDELLSPEIPSIIDIDTMVATSDSMFDPADKGKSNWRMLAEAKRTVEVSNNVYFQPKGITNLWTQWNDTAKAGSGDSLYTPSWMNARTTHMFNDPTDWPGFSQSGNLLNTDPGYGSTIGNVITGGDTYGLGLAQYFTLIRSGQSPAIGWGYQVQSIPSSSTSWVPSWPLPEQANGDLKYTASLTAPDGKPYGDPYWFTGVTGIKQQPTSAPAKFNLSNNYPNPFNPSTTIKVSLVKSGVMSLKIYNVLGQVVKVVDEGSKPAGEYTYNVSMDNFASGVYFYKLQQGSNIMTRKMILLK